MAQRVKTDWILFFTILIMVAFGLVMVYSASSVMAEIRYHSTMYFISRQLLWAVISFFVLMYLKRRDYRRFQDPTWAFTGLGVVLMMLVAVYFLDWKTHRWFRIPGLGSLQPSELAKPALVIFLAWFISNRAQMINNRRTLWLASMALGMLAILVGVADLGTAIVLALTAAVMFYVAGLDRRYVMMALTAGAVLAVFFVVAKPYRLARIIGYVDPNYTVLSYIDPSGGIKNYVNESITTRDTSYQPRQSRIAVGSGGALGLGLMQGRQKLLYLPEAHTDYIYAVVGEELGTFGCSALLAGFLIIFWRGLRVYWLAPDEFGRYLALGVTATIVIQAFINMSVVLDLGPSKGIPLPMISSGGSSLLSTLVSLGLLLGVSEHAG
ncbi:MAG TPA: FtsW/RodA/SpoVE family cell cycle protein [Bryobacteraceae bacterium]|nr:FtsW/RodA/SpoVE family cell cycle protein [Bryobacteraceae bacterium]